MLQPSPLSPSFTHHLPCSNGQTALKCAIDNNKADVAAYLRSVSQYAQPDGLEIFAVQELLGICVKSSNKKPTLFYKVWWRGYAKPLVGCNNSWEPISNLSASIVEAWNREHAAAYQAAVAKIERLKATPTRAPPPPQSGNIADSAGTTSRNSGRMLLPNSKYN